MTAEPIHDPVGTFELRTTHRAAPSVQEELAEADRQIALATALMVRANAARARRAHLRVLLLTELRHGHVQAAIRLLDDEAWDA